MGETKTITKVRGNFQLGGRVLRAWDCIEVVEGRIQFVPQYGEKGAWPDPPAYVSASIPPGEALALVNLDRAVLELMTYSIGGEYLPIGEAPIELAIRDGWRVRRFNAFKLPVLFDAAPVAR